jgi:hypothetical protein
MTIELKTITEGWQDEQRTTTDKLRAVENLTAGCPCDRCVSRDTCAVTRHQCTRFHVWVQTGRA